MAKLDWARFDANDDGYYHEPMTLKDADNGAIVHQARRREQALVAAFIKRSGYLALAKAVERGEHYRAEELDTKGLESLLP